jgi:tRNA (mo5U34)-methyltransferase
MTEEQYTVVNSDDDIRRTNLAAAVAVQPYWYHKIELPGGIITPGWAPIDAAKYAIPDDLTGKRVLDIGAWDGYWTWEALKRGAAEVVAIDDFSDCLGQLKDHGKWETFDICREAFGFTEMLSGGSWRNAHGQTVSRVETSIYAVDAKVLDGRFDVVFFFGTVYHLKHPLLALEKIAAVCTGELFIESAILDDYSPYRGGSIGSGYPNNDMVTEFYPGKQYGGNASNWWVPTLQCLAAQVESVGFSGVKAWPLVEGAPKGLPECRGFVYGSKTGKAEPNVDKLANIPGVPAAKPLAVRAVVSVPRLGFQDNMFSMLEGLIPNNIPCARVSGAFWGQCLERGIMQAIDLGADAVLTIDYDTIFRPDDVKELVRLLAEHPEADAIVPMQVGRGDMPVLMTVKTLSGQPRKMVARTEFESDLLQIATGHYGLTLLRSSSLLKLKHPWFIGTPDGDGMWGPGRVDDDIHLWKLLGAAGMKVFLANRVVVGHLQLMATWPDINQQPLYQHPQDFFDKGKPDATWK